MVLIISLILFLVGLTVLSVVLWVKFLRLGARWSGAEIPSRRLALFILVFATVMDRVASYFLEHQLSQRNLSPTSTALIELGLSVFLVCWLVSVFLHVSFWRGVRIWLATLIPSGAILALLLLVFIPFVAEAYRASGNSMAPTLLDRHYQTPCPVCDEPAYGGADRSWESSLQVICDGFHVSDIQQKRIELQQDRIEVHEVPVERHVPDRFLVTKFLKPRRWEIITFRYPGDSSTIFVKRLVGLPGEKVVIKDGSVWIDGEKLAPPEELRGIEYVTQFEVPFAPSGVMPCRSGTEESPATLGPDEYFVLGDFSERSKDSRLWEQGAPGHPSYAVPGLYIEGVVTHIYWPPSRCGRFGDAPGSPPMSHGPQQLHTAAA